MRHIPIGDMPVLHQTPGHYLEHVFQIGKLFQVMMLLFWLLWKIKLVTQEIVGAQRFSMLTVLYIVEDHRLTSMFFDNCKKIFLIVSFFQKMKVITTLVRRLRTTKQIRAYFS